MRRPARVPWGWNVSWANIYTTGGGEGGGDDRADAGRRTLRALSSTCPCGAGEPGACVAGWGRIGASAPPHGSFPRAVLTADPKIVGKVPRRSSRPAPLVAGEEVGGYVVARLDERQGG